MQCFKVVSKTALKERNYLPYFSDVDANLASWFHAPCGFDCNQFIV